MAKVILALKEAYDLHLVGGKAKALGELIRAGFKVPDGFVITTEATTKNMNEIMRWYGSLTNAKLVAVRSSAVAEDAGKNAWAGQLDTFLNVSSDELMEKVQLCWRSSRSARARAYAKQSGLHASRVAVIVQAMVQGDASGIAFSANPVTLNDQELVIEAGFGLNEPIVSGQITPDTYFVKKSSLEILHKQVSVQKKMLVLGPDGHNRWQKPKVAQGQKITDRQINKLAGEVVKLEKFFGFPVDSEWTFSGRKLFILQSRPITTLG